MSVRDADAARARRRGRPRRACRRAPRGRATGQTRRSAASAAAASTSRTITSSPARAHTSAMPDPIRPPPTTPTRVMSPTRRMVLMEAVGRPDELSRRAFLALGSDDRRQRLLIVGRVVGADDCRRQPHRPGTVRRRPPATRPPTTTPSTADDRTTAPTRLRPRSRSACRPATPTSVGRAVDPPRRRRPCPTRSTSTWEVATDEPFAVDHRVGGQVTATVTPTATASTSTPTSRTPSWYRFRAGGRTSPVGAGRPGRDGRRAAPRRRLVPALRDRVLRRPPRHRRVGAGPRRVPRRLHLRGRRRSPSAATACAATTAPSRPTSTATGRATRSTSATPTCRRRGRRARGW